MPHFAHPKECDLTVGLLWVGYASTLAHNRHRQLRPRAEKGDVDDEDVGWQGYVGALEGLGRGQTSAGRIQRDD